MATTTNYSWTTPDDTALVKDGASAIRSLGTAIDTTVFNNATAAIAKSIVDAKGDIIAATAADTVSRLAVGSNNTVLTADSSTATGLKWATVSAGGKTLLSTTSLSGASTTISNISGDYTDLDIVIYGVNPSDETTPIMKPNNTTNCRYQMSRYNVGDTGSLTATDLAYLGIGAYLSRSDNAIFMTIKNYASTSIDYKPFIFAGMGPYQTTSYITLTGGGTFYSTTAITSLVFSVPSGTQTGTVLVYGVK